MGTFKCAHKNLKFRTAKMFFFVCLWSIFVLPSVHANHLCSAKARSFTHEVNTCERVILITFSLTQNTFVECVCLFGSGPILREFNPPKMLKFLQSHCHWPCCASVLSRGPFDLFFMITSWIHYTWLVFHKIQKKLKIRNRKEISKS